MRMYPELANASYAAHTSPGFTFEAEVALKVIVQMVWMIQSRLLEIIRAERRFWQGLQFGVVTIWRGIQPRKDLAGNLM